MLSGNESFPGGAASKIANMIRRHGQFQIDKIIMTKQERNFLRGIHKIHVINKGDRGT